MHRPRFLFTFLASFATLAGATGCSSGDTTPNGGGSGTASGTASGMSGTASGTSGTTSGTGSGSSSGSGSNADGGVLFATDVLMPIIQVNCSMGGVTCHGSPSVATAANQMRPYLGPQSGTPTAATIANILTALDQPSSEDPSMPLVTPFDSTKSYLMYKVDGTQNTLDCSKGDDSGMCGLFMPYDLPTGMILPQNVRDTIRAWINEGAPNN